MAQPRNLGTLERREAAAQHHRPIRLGTAAYRLVARPIKMVRSSWQEAEIFILAML
jgi:hypothetical protein